MTDVTTTCSMTLDIQSLTRPDGLLHWKRRQGDRTCSQTR